MSKLSGLAEMWRAISIGKVERMVYRDCANQLDAALKPIPVSDPPVNDDELYLVWRPVAGWVIGRYGFQPKWVKPWDRDTSRKVWRREDGTEITDATHWTELPGDPK